MKKHSVHIAGHPTSITLEDEFWVELKKNADKHGQSVNQMVTSIDTTRGERNLSSAIRVYILNDCLKR